MKKELKKRVNKKVLLLSLVLLSFIIISLVLVYAADSGSSTTDPNGSFFDRWVSGTFKDYQAKMLLWLMMFAVLLVLLNSLGISMPFCFLISIPASFILVAYVTPDSIIGVFKSYQTLPLVLATFLPLAILFAFTYLSVVKASRTLMTTQWLLWLIYGSFIVMKIIISWWVWNGNVWYEYLSQVVTLPTPAESFWYWSSMGTSAVVATIMVFASGHFMNWAILKTAGLEDAAAKKRFKEASNALTSLAEIEKSMANAK